MKPTLGQSHKSFLCHDPYLRLRELLFHRNNTMPAPPVPSDVWPMLLLHGVEDDVVPFTSMVEAAFAVRSCGIVDVKEC